MLTSLPTLPTVLSAQPAESKEEVTVRLRGSLRSAAHLPHGLTWDKTLPSPPPRFYSKGLQFLMRLAQVRPDGHNASTHP